MDSFVLALALEWPRIGQIKAPASLASRLGRQANLGQRRCRRCSDDEASKFARSEKLNLAIPSASPWFANESCKGRPNSERKRDIFAPQFLPEAKLLRPAVQPGER